MKNPIYVKLLKRADKTIWDGVSKYKFAPSEYICDNIMAQTVEEAIAARKLKFIISDRIDEHYGIDRWLKSKGVPAKDLTPIRLQTYRKAWIKLLIKEFGGKR
jgi:hypothetical protein